MPKKVNSKKEQGGINTFIKWFIDYYKHTSPLQIARPVITKAAVELHNEYNNGSLTNIHKPLHFKLNVKLSHI
jgi:hypothetical protein